MTDMPTCKRCGLKHEWFANETAEGKWTVSVGHEDDGIAALDLPNKGVAHYVGFQLAERLCEQRQRVAAETRAAKLLEALRAIEWYDDLEYGCEICALCGRGRSRGHAPECKVGVALAKAAAPTIREAETGGARETREPEKCPICGMSAATGYPHLHTDDEIIKRLRSQLSGSRDLCKLYFEIASEAIGEAVVRAKRDVKIAEMAAAIAQGEARGNPP